MVQFRVYIVQEKAKWIFGVRSQDIGFLGDEGDKRLRGAQSEYWGPGDLLVLMCVLKICHFSVYVLYLNKKLTKMLFPYEILKILESVENN